MTREAFPEPIRGDLPRVDPVVVEVIGSAVLSVAEEMGEALIRAAYSSNIKERKDTSACIFDIQGRTLAQASHIPMHLGSFLGVVESVLERFPRDTMAAGDMFIGNDPYTAGGTHLPDLTIVAPVFHDGELVAFLANLGHHADFIDRGEGRHIFQEGLRIPPMKIMENGEVRREVLDIILTNCQVPNDRLGDLRAQFAATRLGTRRFEELCERYGRDVLFEAIEELLNYTERRTRAGISRIPDGTYEFTDLFDSEKIPGSLELHVRIQVSGDEIHLDFSNNPPQVPANLNVLWQALLAAVYYAVKALVDPTLPPNAGMYRAIQVTATPGSIVNCVAPAAVSWRTQVAQRVVDLVHGALAQSMPERVTAAHNGATTGMEIYGTNPRTGGYFFHYESLGGGFGARATKDGLDGVQVHVTNTTNLPIEALEMEFPILADRLELLTDSGGPGRFRGGMGFERSYRMLQGEATTSPSMTRRLSQPWGLFGGHGGASGKLVVRRSDGSEEDVTLQSAPLHLEEGDAVAVFTPGAGGYGDPRERDRGRVVRDLREGRISRQSAVEAYGLDPDEATLALEDDKDSTAD